MDADRRSPRLPPELEQLIFTFTAQVSPPTLQSLLLVAHRTHEWLEPLRYSALDLGPTASGEIFTLVSQKDPAFLATHVTSILLSSRNEADEILTKCTGVMDLVFFGYNNTQSFTQLATFSRLRMLSLEYRPSLAFGRLLGKDPTLVFPTLTHLDFNHFSFPAFQKMALHFPSLSHFMVDFWRAALVQLPDILSLQQIRRVVLKDDSGRDVADADLPMDEKFVRIVLTEDGIWLGGHVEISWKERVSGRTDLWELAEQMSKFQYRATPLNSGEVES
ncbi:hypothetical protein DL96DRAFT_1471265 [Flagelloscypha sp. PMI_526]|nr:hypothetical protein DL96DRAFT_1471265 [Flagelloscypha sp. PMI_526]